MNLTAEEPLSRSRRRPVGAATDKSQPCWSSRTESTDESANSAMDFATLLDDTSENSTALSCASRPSGYSPREVLRSFTRANAAPYPPPPANESVRHDVLLTVDRFAMAAALSRRTWLDPHITVGTGAVALEWWYGARKLTVDVTAERRAPLFTKVWGPDIETEMADGELNGGPPQYAELWRWLTQ